MTDDAPGRSAFWPLRDLPVVGWLAAAGALAALRPVLETPRWLLLHLLLLGAATHAILVWSRYFTDALLHLPPRPRRPQSQRLALVHVGALAVVVGVPLALWAVTVAGAAAVVVAVGWHGATLWRDLRTGLGSRFAGTVRYYVAAAALLPVGATIGAVLARDIADPWHTRLLVAHATVNLLGWVGLTVLGTLVTLWPTILRTRITDGAERMAAQALPWLVAAVVTAAAGAVAGLWPVVGAALAAYAVALLPTLRTVTETVRRKPPRSFAAWSVLAGLGWLTAALVVLAVRIGSAASDMAAHHVVEAAVPLVAIGFVAQVLLGATSYLVPVALGGGPTASRAAHGVLDRAWPTRVVLANAGLLLVAVGLPGHVADLAWVLVVGSLLTVLPLVVLAVRASHRARRQPNVWLPHETAAGPRGQLAGYAATGVAIVALVVAGGVALDPSAVDAARAGRGQAAVWASGGATATGHTTTVSVVARGMRFTPAVIDVPVGDRLIIALRNDDDAQVHDLVLDGGADSGRLAPGASARVDVGVVGRDLEGWCSVVGHRQMGMTLQVRVTGASPSEEAPGTAPEPGTEPDARLDPGAAPPEDLVARDAALPPLARDRVHRTTFHLDDVIREVAPGVTQTLWTYNGTMPGPVLHGQVGDRFVVRLVNDAAESHSLDFHAGSLAPDGPMRTIAPGQELVYRFRATRAGIWLYHCGTMPMSVHIANGLFGAVVIEPPGLPHVDRSYLLVQSELYFGPPDEPADAGKVAAETPDAVVFNGYADQYDVRPLVARVGERVRIWVLDAGPSRPTSFHVVGGQFDTTYAEGAYLLRRSSSGRGGAQSLGLQAAQGGFVELTFPEPGHYPFVSHVMVDAERGAHGVVWVTR